jgi:hypothetical protein
MVGLESAGTVPNNLDFGFADPESGPKTISPDLSRHKHQDRNSAEILTGSGRTKLQHYRFSGIRSATRERSNGSG